MYGIVLVFGYYGMGIGIEDVRIECHIHADAVRIESFAWLEPMANVMASTRKMSFFFNQTTPSLAVCVQYTSNTAFLVQSILFDAL